MKIKTGDSVLEFKYDSSTDLVLRTISLFDPYMPMTERVLDVFCTLEEFFILKGMIKKSTGQHIEHNSTFYLPNIGMINVKTD